jgi:hypothetical protein
MNAWNNGFLYQEVEIILFDDIFFVLFCVLIPDFKVRDIVLTVINHIFHVKEKIPNLLEKVFLNFLLVSFLFRRQ